MHSVIYYILLDHIIPYNAVSYHITSYHIISHRIISYHIISHHIISYHVILCYNVCSVLLCYIMLIISILLDYIVLKHDTVSISCIKKKHRHTVRRFSWHFVPESCGALGSDSGSLHLVSASQLSVSINEWKSKMSFGVETQKLTHEKWLNNWISYDIMSKYV